MSNRSIPWLRRGALLPVFVVLPMALESGDPPRGTEPVFDPLVGMVESESSAAAPPGEPFPVPAGPLPRDPVRAEASRVATFSPAQAPFRLRADVPHRGEPLEVRFAVQAISVLPAETLELDAPPGSELLTPEGAVLPGEDGRWRWTAPDSAGAVPLRIHGPEGRIDLNVLVMRPMGEVRNGVLNGYRIGRYAEAPGQPAPVGFVEVAPEDEDILVSPHFTLGQFLCKDPGDPRYLVLSEALVVKLEAVLAAVNESGIPSGTLHIMSGFRTPAYNRAIGNTTTLSRHLWGEAADIFIDNTGNGMMDDLNGDGVVDDRDARLLMGIVEEVAGSGAPGVLPGGLSLYRTRPGRGPFIHVDVRGTAVRW